MTLKQLIFATPLLLTPVLLAGQGRGVAPAELLKPLGEHWPTYSGDYTGKRYSSLKQINQTTVKNLTLAWSASMTAGPGRGGGGGGGGFGRGGGGGATINIGGPGKGEFFDTEVTIKGTPLMVDGTLYVSAPDHAWAIDARDGRELWRYFWKTTGGTHIGNRGLGIWNNYLYMATPDNYLVSLDATTGKERWNKVIADLNQQYFSTSAPIVIDNHVLIGTGNDLDSPGIHAVLRRGDWRRQVEALHRAHESRRSGPRHLGQPGGGESWWRTPVAARCLRS